MNQITLEDERALQRLRLTWGLKTGSIDHHVLAHAINGHVELGAEGLLQYVFDDRRFLEDHGVEVSEYPGWNECRVKAREQYPVLEIVELLSRFGLEEQVFAYLARSSGPPCETMARAFEYLQPSMFANPLIDHRSRPRPGHGFTPFRLAQKIRNEHGFARWYSISECFGSFEDIITLERSFSWIPYSRIRRPYRSCCLLTKLYQQTIICSIVSTVLVYRSLKNF